MKTSSRRSFMKTMMTLPLVGAGLNVIGTESNAINLKHGHKLKISLNVYSFNSLLRDDKIDLYDVMDFCAKHNFDAIDPTGYYFPGYPEVPSDEYINNFKRQAFLLGLDISGTAPSRPVVLELMKTMDASDLFTDVRDDGIDIF